MLKLNIEESLTGPLAHPPTRIALENKVAAAATLDECAAEIETTPWRLRAYRGGNHIAVHSLNRLGRFSHTRWAIITEGEG